MYPLLSILTRRGWLRGGGTSWSCPSTRDAQHSPQPRRVPLVKCSCIKWPFSWDYYCPYQFSHDECGDRWRNPFPGVDSSLQPNIGRSWSGLQQKCSIQNVSSLLKCSKVFTSAKCLHTASWYKISNVSSDDLKIVFWHPTRNLYPTLPQRCCNITVESGTYTSQKGVWVCKLSLHRKTILLRKWQKTLHPCFFNPLSKSRRETRSLYGTFVKLSKFRLWYKRFRIHRYVEAAPLQQWKD